MHRRRREIGAEQGDRAGFAALFLQNQQSRRQNREKRGQSRPEPK
jgi:hypothetical protein